MRALVGVQRITPGSVEVLGAPAGSASLRDRIGYVTQQPSVYDDLTVTENLRFFARILGVDRRRVRRVHRAGGAGQPGRPGGEPALRRPAVAGLAGGRAARQAAAARARRAHGRASTRCSASSCGRPSTGSPTTGAAVLVSSHVMDEASRCERLLLMREGRLIADDTPAGLLSAPAPRTSSTPSWRSSRTRRRRHEHRTPTATGAVTTRVLTQLRRDHRTLAMLLVLPCALMTLLWWMFNGLPGDGFSASVRRCSPWSRSSSCSWSPR